MNSFGLGLVLNFVDNASAGMNSASQTFNQMSAMADSMTSSVGASATEMTAIAYSLSAVGDTLTDIGSSVIGTFSGITQQVIDSGMAMQGYRMQMSALYGDNLAEEKMQEITDYAKTSVFEIQSLIPAVTMMKAVGIEAMQEVTTSSGSATQRLLDYASDIAAMVPNMHNVYGTGVAAAMGAMKEYIAEGNAMSLKRGAGLDITGILGEDKGATMEERTQQIADLVEKLNILGYTENLQGTPTQRLSNLQDVLFETLTKIADSGVFEVYCGLLEKLSSWLFNIADDEETFNEITGILSDTISTLLSPLEKMLDWVIANSEAIIDWVKNNSTLTKNILLTVAAVGAFLVVGGSLLKMLSSIAFAMSGFQMLKSLPVLLGKLAIAALPLIAVAGLAYTAWSENMGGIRDSVTNLLSNLGDIVAIFFDAWEDNTLSEENFLKAKELGILPFISSILQLKYYWDYFLEGFKNGFKSVFLGVFSTLSAFGIDVDALMTKLSNFFAKLTQPGSEEEWTRLGEAVGALVAAIGMLYLVVKIFTPIVRGLVAIGKAAKWVANIFNTIKSMKVWTSIAKGIKDVATVIRGGQGVGVFAKLVEVIKAVASGGIGLKDAMTIVFGAVGTTVAGIISLVVGVGAAIFGFVKQLIDGFSWLWEIIKWVGIALGVVGAILLGAELWPAIIVGAVIGAITTIIVLIKDNWNAICDFFATVGPWIYNNVIKPVADFFVWLWNGIVGGVVTAFNAVKNFLISIPSWINNNVIQPICNFFASVANWIYSKVIQPVVNFFMTYIYPIFAKIVEIVAKIIEIIVVLIGVLVKWIYNNVIKPIIDFFVGLWNALVTGFNNCVEAIKTFFSNAVSWIDTNIIKPIGNFFTALWNRIVTGVNFCINGIKSVFSTITSWINSTIIQPITEFFSGLWSGLVEGVNTFISTIQNAFSSFVSFIELNIIQPISDFFTTLWEGIQTAFDTVAETISGVIKGAVQGVLNFVCGIINGVIWALNAAIDIINAIPGVNISKIEELELPELAMGGVVDKPTTAIIGEAGAEAVVPLENNTGWIEGLASAIAPMLSNTSSTVVPSEETVVNNNSNYDNRVDNNILTSSTSIHEGSSQTSKEEVHNDYSVTFEAGSVVIQLSGTSDDDLEKAAEKLMKIIARKQQLKAMAVRK